MENNIKSQEELTQLLVENEIINNNEEKLEEIKLEETFQCRICLEEETNKDLLISPCKCSGTSKYVHKECLRTWRYQDINADGFYRCMECNENYILMESENREIIKIFYFWDKPKYVFKFQNYLSLLLYFITAYSDYYLNDCQFAKILPINYNISQEENLVFVVKNDPYYFLTFYVSISIFIQNYIFLFIYLTRSLYFIKNKCFLLKKIFLSFYCNNFYYNFFWLILYLGIQCDLLAFGLNLSILVQLFSYRINSLLIEYHDLIIEKYNNDIRTEIAEYTSEQDESDIEQDESDIEAEYDEEQILENIEDNIEMV